ncbi:hypothetical protein AQ914_04435 [Burkholderia pseudomallei]|nr:hypothetical protein AQ914_04435 [Burkholderia pseudomallei]
MTQCIRNDNDGIKTGGDACALDFIKLYRGNQAQAAELIPGTPIGNYYNKFQFGDRLRLIEIDNGRQGTVGMQFDTARMEDGDCYLFSAGALSGCTMIYALKGDMLYAYHAGTVKNGDDDWTTAIHGARSIYETHRLVAVDTVPDGSMVSNNSELVAFLQQNFDHAMMVYSGKGSPLTVGEREHVRCFDYSKMSLRHGIANAGSALALLKKEGGTVKIAFLGDNMEVDRACQVHSLDAQLFRVPGKA